MQSRTIILPSIWGKDLSHKYMTNHNSSLAVFFPGRNYSCEQPLLYYLSRLAFVNKHDILLLEYGYQAARLEYEPDKVEHIVRECYDSIDQVIENYEDVVFVSKSLGTYISCMTDELIEEKLIKHIFLTPIKSSIPLINKCGGTVIYGTEDELLSEEETNNLVGSPNVEISKIEGANHGLEVEDIEDSLNIVKTVLKLSSKIFGDYTTD